MPASTPSLERHHWLVAAFVGLGIATSACTTFSDLAIGAGGSNVVNPNGKTTGSTCTTGNDCQSGSCTGGTCTALSSAQTTDGKKDGSETDVDCGGGTAPQCADGKTCAVSTDCTNGVCTSGRCASPSPTDGIKNADETDVDCGGAVAPKCAADKACGADTDCTSTVCSYAKKCLAGNAKSCAQQHGGDTCGAGETGDAAAKHESCCTTVDNGNGLLVGKYQITAGRMRAFATKVGGDIRSWATTTSPKNFDTDYLGQLPSSMNELNGSLGPNTKRGCSVGTSKLGGRTWFQQLDGDMSDFPQDVLDEKSLNCLPWYLAMALCSYDGGRLPTHAENQSFVTNNGSTQWPWGGSFSNATKQDSHVAHYYSYATPNAANIRTGSDGTPLDRAFYMAPPGRFPSGANQIGVQDVIGDMLIWTSDGYNDFTWTSSWEEHPWQQAMGNWTQVVQSQEGVAAAGDGYYAIGGRCVFDK